jgi:hypothetical protein
MTHPLEFPFCSRRSRGPRGKRCDANSGNVARDPSGERLVDGLAAPVGFHAEHLDDLALPTYEFGQVDPLRFPKRPCLWTHALGEKAITSGRAPGGRGLVSTFSLAGLVSAGNSDIQGGMVPAFTGDTQAELS